MSTICWLFTPPVKLYKNIQHTTWLKAEGAHEDDSE